MKLIRRILFILLVLALAVVIFQNQQSLGMPLVFSFLQWSFSLVLGFWILFAFAAGAALFALVDAWRSMMLRMEIRRKDQEIARLLAEVQELKDAREVARTQTRGPLAGDAFPE